MSARTGRFRARCRAGVTPDGEINLGIGSDGEAVADVQRRLADLGCPPGVDPEGCFREGTRAAVEAFQYRRGLRVDGVCGRQTWSALVEAGRRLGDRFLYRRSPMLRGDDVAELQQRLSALGFDTGRVDGIFGDLTSAALGEFQRNAGLPVDGIAGAATVSELLRFGSRHDGSELVASVRDRERLRQAPRTLAGRRVAIGEEGGLAATVGAVRRLLVSHGALVTTHHHPEGSIQASEANAARAEVFVGHPARHRRRMLGLLLLRLPILLARRAATGRAPAPRPLAHPRTARSRQPGHVPPVAARDQDAGRALRDQSGLVMVERSAVIARAVVDSLAEWVDTAWD